MPLDQARSQIQGDYSENSSNFQKTEAMDELAKRKTEELTSVKYHAMRTRLPLCA